jgi:hypothetical protein
MKMTLINRIAGVGLLAMLSAAGMPSAWADGHEGHEVHHEHEMHRVGEPYHVEHWSYDSLHRHDHYYPAIGYGIDVLPGGFMTLGFGGRRFFFNAGVWYEPAGARYVVVRPPVGVVIPVLPPDYATVWVGSMPYYYANDTYYITAPGGYAVTEAPAAGTYQEMPPDSAPMPVPAPAPAPQQNLGTWYFCTSANAYYPYVKSCPEGWKPVPASAPPAP